MSFFIKSETRDERNKKNCYITVLEKLRLDDLLYMEIYWMFRVLFAFSREWESHQRDKSNKMSICETVSE